MILEYHRPDTLEQALALLARSNPTTLPMGGGSVLNAPSDEEVAVVDLQNLGLNVLKLKGNKLNLGAALTLQGLLDNPDIPDALSKAIRHEATHNLRQVATIAGTLVVSDGRSAFTSCMLALDAQLILEPGAEELGLGDLLHMRTEKLPGRLLTQIVIPMNVKLSYDYVARSSADLPIVCAAVTQWPSGRTRVVLGGYGSAPTLALDGPQADGWQEAVQNAYGQAGDDWASAEYRSEISAVLSARCLENIAIIK
ncbi:MAG: hypothetical protein FVQ83_01370 [Chloroflexi bacterium]|nr:hypothetical protein [Chloroflexota bacterium]